MSVGAWARPPCPLAPRPAAVGPCAPGRKPPPPLSSATRPTAIKPRLWGVRWYSYPGLPSPTMSFKSCYCPDRIARRIAFTGMGRSAPNNPWQQARVVLPRPRVARLFLLAFLLGFLFLAFSRFLFAFFGFRLALTDQLGLSRGGGFSNYLRRLFFLHLQGHHVGDHARGVRQHFHLGSHRQVGDAQIAPQRQFTHVNGEVLRDIVGKTFQLDFTQNEVEDPTLHLNALRLAHRMHGDPDLQYCVTRDPHHVHMP